MGTVFGMTPALTKSSTSDVTMNTTMRASRKAGITNFLRQPHAAVDFHGAGVAPLHLGQKLRRVLLLKQDAAHTAAAKVDCERYPYGPGADNDYLGIHCRA